MKLKINKPNIEKSEYSVSFYTGKKTREIKIAVGSPDWKTSEITQFLIDLADFSSDKIEIIFENHEVEQNVKTDAQLAAIYNLFKTFAEEINKDTKI